MNKFAETAIIVASFTFTSGVSYVFGIGAGDYVRKATRFTTGRDINRMDVSVFAIVCGSVVFPRTLRTHIKFASGFFLAGYLTARS